jgi:hypothetical protein
MGAHGVRLGHHSQIINVTTSEHALTGFFGGDFNVFERVLTEANGGQAIVAGDDSLFKESNGANA